MLTFEGAPIQGVSSIIEKLTVSPHPRFNCARRNDLTAVADVALPEGATQDNDARRAAFFPDHCVTHRERDWLARGE
jgi:hypothetical protein